VEFVLEPVALGLVGIRVLILAMESP